MSEPIALSGRCLCGAVTFTVSSPDGGADICDCNMCQRWSAGPFMSLEGARDLVFAGEDNLQFYGSSDWAERGFCKTCGSNLLYRLKDRSAFGVSAGALDDKSKLHLTREIFTDEKPAFYVFGGDHQKMTGPEFLKFIGVDAPQPDANEQK